jgi:dephospho-CoA kinase
MGSLRIGLTGGIASGKTTVAKLFAALGVPVIDADEVARQVVASGAPALQQLVTLFGPAILNAHGELDRRRLRDLVFAAPHRRQQLDALLHPLIRSELQRQAALAGGAYQILVIPLLVETGADYVDRVLVVDCSEQTQLQRLQARDGQTPEQARAMLAAQTTRAARLQRANDVISNDSPEAMLAAQVAALHAKYLKIAEEKRDFSP